MLRVDLDQYAEGTERLRYLTSSSVEEMVKNNVINDMISAKGILHMTDSLVDLHFFNLLWKKLGKEGIINLQENWEIVGSGKILLQRFKKTLHDKYRSLKRKNKEERWSEPTNFIMPEIGTVIELTDDWEFRLFGYKENIKVMTEMFGVKEISEEKSINAILYKGCRLRIDSIKIKKGSHRYSTISFYIDKATENLVLMDALMGDRQSLFNKNGKALTPRFSVRLADVNQIKCMVNTHTLSMS